MKSSTTIDAVIRTALALATTALVACGDPAGDDGGDSSGADTTGGPTTDEPTTTSPTTTSPTTTSPTTTMTTDEPTTTDTPDTTETTDPTDDTTDTGTTGGDGYAFADDPYDAYTQIDRHGAVEAGTAGIAASQGLGFNPGSDITIRDAYNASNPVEDAAAMWLPEIAESIMFFHGALDDDIMSLNLIPATFDETVAQAGPVILPDTIKYDPSMPTAYPNGRTLTDPVVDITLAAVLLQLGPGQPLSLFADLPLNPPANDVPFGAEFPYLAAPHDP